jgi:pre-mRNA-splicing helicase BRR2
MADLVYIAQSAGRLMRCLFEICLRRNWAPLAEKGMLLTKAVNHRMWPSQNPLRQFKTKGGKPILAPHVVAQLEKKELPWDRCARLLRFACVCSSVCCSVCCM